MKARSIAFGGVFSALALLVAACTPGPPVGGGNGEATDAAPSTRTLLSQDLNNPPRLDCANWRYNKPNDSALPADYTKMNYRYTSLRSSEKAGSVHFLCGQRGPAADLAWEITTGRDDVLIAVLDSGIKWRDTKAMDQLATAAYLNPAELPLPTGATSYDANGDGHFDIADYAADPLATDLNGNDILDPEDLILNPRFFNGIDDDNNGYIDDISGWDFLFDDNNPLDNVNYGHGTGEAEWSTGTDGNGGEFGSCSGCRFLPVRVSDSFIAEGARFASGVLFGVDSGADIIQEALGAVNNSPAAQQAIDAAFYSGVSVVASMADEASKHPNLPAALNHTITMNSITSPIDFLGDATSIPGADSDYLQLNGCTNYGAITWISIPSSSCSSEAVGQGAGWVGLIESAARDADVETHPNNAGGPRQNVLSANEVAQLLGRTADDIDFSTPAGNSPANNSGTDGFKRYPTTPGWDATTGHGRINVYEAVRAAATGEIPPEADIETPRFFDIESTSGSLSIDGRVAAVRSGSYSYRVEWTTGLQAPPYPGADNWRTVASRAGLTEPLQGSLATVDLGQIAAALPGSGTGTPSENAQPDEDRFAVRLRLVVTDAEGRNATAQKQIFVHEDPTLATNEQIAAGSSSPVFADLDGNGADELIVATDSGLVYAYQADGSELAGWPQQTRPAGWWHSGSPTAQRFGIAPPLEAAAFGAPLAGDLDGDGEMEVVVADAGGQVKVYGAHGATKATMDVDPQLSTQEDTDANNRLKPGFLSSPSAGDIDGDGKAEIVAAALDRHVYAWEADGAEVSGFPVLLVDPSKTSSVNPDSHAVTFNTDDVLDGGELIVTPTVADLTGDGKAEIIVGAQEQYDENVDVFPALGIRGLSGNARVYAIWGDGTDHEAATDRVPQHPAEQAYMPGWPVPVAMTITGVLPTVGNGVNTQAAVGEVDGDPEPEVVVASSAGPVHVFDPDGSGAYFKDLGIPVALDWLGEPFGARADSRDGGILNTAFGGPSVGDISGNGRLDVTAPTAGLGQASDQLIPGNQVGDTQLMAWNGQTRAPLTGFPQRTSDLAFFVTPAIVDVDGDGDNDVVAANGLQMVDAIDGQGNDAEGWPKLTGGWVVGTPGFGDIDGDGTAEVAVVRRDGLLLMWHTGGSTDALDQWPRFGHDGFSSGDYRNPIR